MRSRWWIQSSLPCLNLEFLSGQGVATSYSLYVLPGGPSSQLGLSPVSCPIASQALPLSSWSRHSPTSNSVLLPRNCTSAPWPSQASAVRWLPEKGFRVRPLGLMPERDLSLTQAVVPERPFPVNLKSPAAGVHSSRIQALSAASPCSRKWPQEPQGGAVPTNSPATPSPATETHFQHLEKVFPWPSCCISFLAFSCQRLFRLRNAAMENGHLWVECRLLINASSPLQRNSVSTQRPGCTSKARGMHTCWEAARGSTCVCEGWPEPEDIPYRLVCSRVYFPFCVSSRIFFLKKKKNRKPT